MWELRTSRHACSLAHSDADYLSNFLTRSPTLGSNDRMLITNEPYDIEDVPTGLTVDRRRYCTVHCVVSSPVLHNWAATWVNVPFDICAQRRLKSACVAESSLFEWRNYASWISKMRQGRFGSARAAECAGWPESLLGVHVQRGIFWRSGSLKTYCLNQYVVQQQVTLKCLLIKINLLVWYELL